jgi:uncharacterized membrane protein HdeD (DUF308 family)
MSTKPESTSLSRLQIGILVLGLAAALIHLVILNFLMMTIDPLFTLNGIGYLVLIAAYLTPGLARRKVFIRWLTIAYTALTILAWIALGDPGDPLGILTLLIEIGLIILLILDGRKAKS